MMLQMSFTQFLECVVKTPYCKNLSVKELIKYMKENKEYFYHIQEVIGK